MSQNDSIMSSQSYLEGLYYNNIKNLFPLHICKPNDYTAEIKCFAPNLAHFSFTIFSLIFRHFKDLWTT